jgi:hypothetical protein
MVVVGVLTVWTAARGFNFVGTYPTSHWLLTYQHGYIKRGLVGTVMAPWFAFKSSTDVMALIDLVSTVTLACVALGVLRVARRISGNPMLDASIAVALTSSFVVFAASTNGYFDHFLELITLAAVALVLRGRTGVASALCVLGLLVHEMHLVYGLPVVWLALVYRVVQQSEHRLPVRQLAAQSALLFGPCVVVLAAMVWSHLSLSPETIAAVRADVLAVGALGARGADHSVYHLRHAASAAWAQSDSSLVARVFDPAILRSLGPVVVLMGGAVWLQLRAAHRTWLFIPAVLIVLCPIALAAVAWDTGRFWNFVVFHALLVLYAGQSTFALTWQPGTLAASPLFPIVAVVVVANSAWQPVELMAGQLDGRGLVSLRAEPTIHTLDGCIPVFENSNFEAGDLRGWRADGSAFTQASLRKRGELVEHPIGGGVEGGHWVASHTLRKGLTGARRKKGQRLGDRATGTLRSPPFAIAHSQILFVIGGTDHVEQTFAALRIGGTEVHRATGRGEEGMGARSWDVGAYRGKTAQIIVADHSEQGHVNIDGFCGFR